MPKLLYEEASKTDILANTRITEANYEFGRANPLNKRYQHNEGRLNQRGNKAESKANIGPNISENLNSRK